ncbi:MAG: hypothetical protein KDC98_06160 [Planctomycetes bacterium]|nr:hypothetical protein [Planctomycetota bacterium]
MVAPYIGMFLGLILGLVMAGPAGAVVGVVLGMPLGMLVSGVTDARREIPQGTEVMREQQAMLCVPKGQVADVTFLRDARRGHWLDVERCTLCRPEDEVTCAKRCLLLIRDALPHRRHTVEQH